MLERLVNEDREGAQELFHEIVVEKSREIYESLLEDEEVEEADEEEVEEASDEEVEESDDDDLEEGFDLDEFEVEADDDMMMGGDAGDDMMGDIEGDDDMDMDMDMDDEGDEGMEDRVDDLEDALDELKAEFEKLMAGDEGEEADDEMDMGDEEDEEESEEESFEFESSDEEVEESDDEEVEEDSKSPSEEMREYVEKVAGGGLDAQGSAKMGDNGANTKSAVAGKNDMGGTASNIAQSKDEKGTEAGKGAIQGSSLADTSAKPMSTKNVNEPGSKTATNMNAVSGGHGAEKKGKPETADKGAQSTLNKVSSRAK